MNFRPALLALAGLAAGLSCGPSSRDEPTERPPNAAAPGAGAAPEFALVVESRENMGCLVGQRLVEEGLAKLEVGLSISGEAAGEDTSMRRELFLGFPSAPGSTPKGFVVFRLWVEPSAPGEAANVTVANPRFDPQKAGGELTLSASGTGTLRIAPMWGLGKTLEPVWRTCPDADLLEPFQGTFLTVQSLEPPLVPGDSFPLSNGAKTIKGGFEANARDPIARVAKGMALLNTLAGRFGSAESRWVWHGSRLTAEALRGAAKEGGPAQIAVQFDDGKRIGTSEENFEAPVRWRLSVLDDYGKRRGAEVRIAPE